MSSPSTSLSPNPQAARIQKPLRSNDGYYQTVYNDGRSRCIVEYRRRGSKPGHDTEVEVLGHRPHSRLPSTSGRTSSETSSTLSSLSYPSSMSSSRESSLASRDNDAKHVSSRNKSAPVIITTTRTTVSKTQEVTETFQRWMEPTPPPTPHLTRLPTPELPDLGDAPFCECDGMATIVKYCTSCKKEADPRCGWF